MQQINPVEAATDADPWPYYRQLREKRPLYFQAGLNFWVASSHTVIDEALRSTALTVRPIRSAARPAAWVSAQASMPAPAPQLLSK